MIIAHLPSGYILARAATLRQALVVSAALLGSIFPDLDLLWFFLVDGGSIHHHRYWMHAPGFWLAVGLVLLPLVRKLWPARFTAALAFCAAIFLHLVLDTLAGGIMWLWPFSGELFTLVTIPATQAHWLLSFVLHWTFLAELAITACAGWLYLRRARS
jgi:inner membrane protein